MRVLFLTHNFPRKSGDASGSFILRLATALAAEDVEVRVVAPAAPGYPETEVTDGIRVDRFRYAPRRYETLAYGGNMAMLVRESFAAKVTMVGFLGAEFAAGRRVAREFEPDLIHAHWWFPNGLTGEWLSGLINKPLITTLHGTDVRLAKTVGVSRGAFKRVMRRSSAVTAVSRWLADEALSLGLSNPALVAPMPVATDLFSPNGTVRDPQRLLFVGRLSRQKGIEILIDALALTKGAHHLDVVGEGGDRARLEQKAAALGVGDRITWHGLVPQQQLPELYRRAAAVVIPSTDEGLGLVSVEAQLCETPVVAFASGGLTDVVSDNATGVLVQDQTPRGLADSIDSVFARADRGAALGAAGRLHALATFAPESVARRYAALYHSIEDVPQE